MNAAMHAQIEQLYRASREAEAVGAIAAAFAAAEAALRLAEQEGDRVAQCAVLARLAYLHIRMGRLDRAAQLANAALEMHARAPGSTQALIVLGMCAGYANNLDLAEDYFHRAADLSREVGDGDGQIRALHGLASIVYSLRGRFDLALATSAETHRISRRLGINDWGYPMIRAEIYRLIGERDQARQALAELQEIVAPGSFFDGIRCCYVARLALDEEDVELAARHLPQARAVAEDVGSPILAVWTRVEYARLARLQDDIPAARSWADDAIRHAQRSGFTYLEVVARVELARAVWGAGDLRAARSELATIRELTGAAGLRFEEARVALYHAALAAQMEEPEAAARWCEAATVILEGGYGFLIERERGLALPLVSRYLRGAAAKPRAAAEAVLSVMETVAPLPLHVRGLGGFQVHVGRRLTAERQWQRRKAGELFRYLLLQPRRSATLHAVMDELWPEQPSAAAQAQFHQATSTLRRLLEPDLPDRFPSRYLRYEGERVVLHLPPGSTVDFEQFETAVMDALAAQEIAPLEAALALYVDDLFPQDVYADWAAPWRERLAQLLVRALLSLGALYLAADAPLRTLDCCRRVLERDAWQEDAVLLAMQAHLCLSNRPAALRLYHTLARTLRDELGIAPRDDLAKLAASLAQS